PYRAIPEKLREYEVKYASRIHSDKKSTSEYLKLLSRIAMRQKSDRLDAGDNYTISDTESEESSPESDHNLELKSEFTKNDEISEIINMYSY
ncbi:5183_t:CDS:1, partial [Funneliformis mosseae]